MNTVNSHDLSDYEPPPLAADDSETQEERMKPEVSSGGSAGVL
jgi:hypothetical protein